MNRKEMLPRNLETFYFARRTCITLSLFPVDYTKPWEEWKTSKQHCTFVQSISEPVCRANDAGILIPEGVDENTLGIARRKFLTTRRNELITQNCALENQKEQEDAAEICIIEEWIKVQANQANPDKRRELRKMQKKLKNTLNYSKRRKQHAIYAVKKQAEAEWDRAMEANIH